MFKCKICQSTAEPRKYTAREMMFGTRESFDYLECVECGSIQIAEVPTDLGKYYPSDYYSMSESVKVVGGYERPLKRARARFCLTGRGALGKLVARLTGCPYYFEWFKRVGILFDDRILEVGCGRGAFLNWLAADGFTDLTGIDPFVEEDIHYSNGVRILKRELADVHGEHDLILSKHSIEHVPSPVDTLTQMNRLLAIGKHAIVSTPVAGGYGWGAYGNNWIGLDPPRHLVIFSAKGMLIAARREGFELVHTEYNMTDLFFYGSEQFARDVPLNDPRSHWLGGGGRLFLPEQMRRWQAQAEQLNAAGNGDQAVFFLRKVK